jgi:hypothetical protein
VPVTLKLSKKFYETFGDQVTNELVNAFNQVDATYRSDLKEMNESNFARFDAKMDARFAQFDARMDARFTKMDARFSQYDVRFAQFDVKFAELRVDLQRGFVAQSRFMLLGWGTVLATMIAGIFALK